MPDLGSLRKLTLDSFDDVQLWVVKEQGWEIPVLATPCKITETGDAVWQVLPAIAMPAKPTTKLAAILGNLTIIIASSYYLLADDDLKKIARKAEGITPERYYRTPETEKSKLPGGNAMSGIEVAESVMSDEANRFANFLANRTALVRAGVVRSVLKMIAIYGSEWMIERGEPIDLGFAKVNAYPFRRHWKEIFAGKFGTAWLANVHTHRDGGLLKAMDDLHMTSEFYSGDMIALEKGGTIRWSLDISQSKDFDKLAAECERSVKSQVRNEEYARRWIERVRVRINDASASLVSWVADLAKPCASVHPSVDGSSHVIVANNASTRRIARLARHDAVAACVGAGRIRKKPDEVLPPAPPFEDGEVPEVSDLQP